MSITNQDSVSVDLIATVLYTSGLVAGMIMLTPSISEAGCEYITGMSNMEEA